MKHLSVRFELWTKFVKYNRLKVASGFKADRKISTKENLREGSLKREGVLRENESF